MTSTVGAGNGVTIGRHYEERDSTSIRVVQVLSWDGPRWQWEVQPVDPEGALYGRRSYISPRNLRVRYRPVAS